MKKIKFFSSIIITLLSLGMLIYTLIKLARFDNGQTFVQIESGISDIILEQPKPLINPENDLPLIIVFVLIALLGIFFSVKVDTTDENNINFTTTPEGSAQDSESLNKKEEEEVSTLLEEINDENNINFTTTPEGSAQDSESLNKKEEEEVSTLLEEINDENKR